MQVSSCFPAIYKNMKLNIVWQGYFNLTDGVIKRNAYSTAGVYKIAVLQSDGTLAVRYVGQTENITNRMLEHLNDDGSKNKCLAGKIAKFDCRFCFGELSRKDERDAAERALYDHYRPECNDPDHIPNVQAADMNFT